LPDDSFKEVLCKEGNYGKFLFYEQKESSLFGIFQLKFRRRKVGLFFVATVLVSVLARQRVAQAS
jgi:hypothetical protein